MLNHPYSFDTLEQMEEHASRGDGYFTNRSELTLQYLVDHGMRTGKVPSAEETLQRIGY